MHLTDMWNILLLLLLLDDDGSDAYDAASAGFVAIVYCLSSLFSVSPILCELELEQEIFRAGEEGKEGWKGFLAERERESQQPHK